MTFLRTFGYVARRLGREFLIWGGLALVMYIAADLYFLWKSERLHGAWAARYAAVFPEAENPPEPCPAQVALGAAYKTYLGEEAEPHLEPGRLWLSWSLANIYPTLDIFGQSIQSLDGDGIDNGVHYEFGIEGMNPPETEEIDELRDTLDAAIACDAFGWPRDDEALARSRHDEMDPLLHALLAMTMQLAHADDTTSCTETLLRVGRIVPKMRHPEQVWRFSQQIDLGRDWLAAVHYARIHGGLLPEATDELIEVIAGVHAAQEHSLAAMLPETFSWRALTTRFSPEPLWIHRVVRPLTNYQIATVSRHNLALLEAVHLPHRADRAAIYHHVWTTEQPVIEIGGSFLRGIMPGIEQYELFLAECEVLALMLQIESFRRANGHYPEELVPLEAFIPAGFDTREYTDSNMVYRVEDGGDSYAITREVYRYAVNPEAAGLEFSAYHRSWRHQYETAR